MFGINPSEFIVLLAVAAVVLGPERLPEYAQQLARLVRELRRMAQGASAQVRDELGPEFDDIDWRKLDPRQYDPRRIVRDALADVWDPDDPLGLGADPLGLNDDPLGLKESHRMSQSDGEDGATGAAGSTAGGGSGPGGGHSGGGVSGGVGGGGVGGGAVNDSAAASDPPVIFDPDAT